MCKVGSENNFFAFFLFYFSSWIICRWLFDLSFLIFYSDWSFLQPKSLIFVSLFDDVYVIYNNFPLSFFLYNFGTVLLHSSIDPFDFSLFALIDGWLSIALIYALTYYDNSSFILFFTLCSKVSIWFSYVFSN